VNVSQHEEAERAAAEMQHTAEKPYQKPEVRFERVFETTALTCGKTNPTQGQCVFNLSAS
jgi:hypothetical protein